MPGEELPGKIADLVDLLRKQEHANISLADVASVTEVLIATMQSYFQSIDTEIYRECRTMSEYIVNARHEIATLQPKDLEHDRIPRAGMELDAIVQQTEEATNTIMESAETIMAADSSDGETYHRVVEENLLKIFEACSFQDITGQRISKVVETLNYVEERVQELRKLLGVTDEDIRKAMSRDEVVEGEQALMRGPSLQGEGIQQDEIDALMTGDGNAGDEST